MARIVQKYGGTSVGSLPLIAKVAESVAVLRAAGNQVAVVASAMGDRTDELVDMAKALCVDPDPRELDALLATGEQVSVALLAMALRQLGVAAKSYAGFQVCIRTTAAHTKARIESIDTRRLAADLAAGTVPVVAGFQGMDECGDITTIGRGGSDTTAVALAVALKADECQILTDVDGVYTTDPRVVPQARRLPRLTFEEMLELAGQGSRVLHLRAVEFAKKYNMPIRVLSTFQPGPGSLISGESDTVEAPVVVGIAFNRDEAEITVCGLPDAPGTAYRILRAVSEANIEVDMIVLNAPRAGKSDLSFTVHRDDYVKARRLVEAAHSGIPGTSLASSDRVAKLSVVGVGMRSHAGVATKLFKTLAENGVNIRMVSTSEIKISVLIQEADLERGVKALHESYSLASP